MRGRRFLVVLAPFAMVLGACSTSSGPATISVSLQEWAISSASSSTKAGEVTFQVKNVGPKEVHELVVLRTDLDPASLPTDANGKVTEDVPGIEAVDEIEDVEVGKTLELKVSLTPGKYVFMCNIYDENGKVAHYRQGMRTAFIVTP